MELLTGLIGHFDFAPLIYGVIMFLGIWTMYHKLINGHWYRLFVEISVFTLVFMLHGGTMTGGFSAMVASLLAGLFFGRTKRKTK